jgi:hypothetical protein
MLLWRREGRCWWWGRRCDEAGGVVTKQASANTPSKQRLPGPYQHAQFRGCLEQACVVVVADILGAIAVNVATPEIPASRSHSTQGPCTIDIPMHWCFLRADLGRPAGSRFCAQARCDARQTSYNRCSARQVVSGALLSVQSRISALQRTLDIVTTPPS